MYELSLPLILSTFGIIFIAELPDKTALASLVLSARFGIGQVIFGTWLALLVQTIVAILGGSVLTLLPATLIHIVSGLGFIFFSYQAFTREDEEEISEEIAEEKKEVKSETKRKRAGWVTSFLVVFAAEWGDLTQLATAALVAQNGHWLSIGIGATLALWSVAALAAILGKQLTKLINLKRITQLSGVLFAIIGVGLLLSAAPF